jgi:cytochrome c oxidase assembly protein subunit 15
MSGSHREVSRHEQHTPARLIRWLAAAGVLVVLLVTTTSALLRVSTAGLGCEDWPACYGREATGPGDRAQPPRLVRFLHRVGASAAGAVVLGIGLLAVTQPRRHRRELSFFAVLAVLTLGLATLGRATPGALVPAVAMGNVLGGMLMASLLAWLALGERSGNAHAPAWLPRLCGLALVLAFVAVGLGVMTSASYSGLACPGLPLCTTQGGIAEWSAADLHPWRTAAGSPSIHMAHRGAALLAGAVTLVLAWNLGRLGGAGRRLRNLLLVALALQFLLGAGLVTLGLPLPVAVLHNLGAALLLLTLVAAQHRVAGGSVGAGRRGATPGRCGVLRAQIPHE